MNKPLAITERPLALPTKLLLSRAEAAAYCGVSVNTFMAHVKVTPVKIGNCVRYDRRAIDRWAASKNASVSGTDWLGLLDDEGEGVGA